jgi:hypothetical protein
LSWLPGTLAPRLLLSFKANFSTEKFTEIVGKIFDIHPRFFYLARLKKNVFEALKKHYKWQKKRVHCRQEGKV